MNRKEYYDLMTEYGILFSIPTKVTALIDILDAYPHLKTMSCEDALEWLKDRYVEWDNKIQKRLNVE